MRTFFCTIFFAQLFLGFSQKPSINHIPNPSFENMTANFSCPGYLTGGNFNNITKFDWTKIVGWDQPDCDDIVLPCFFAPLGDAVWLNSICNVQNDANTGFGKYGANNYARTGNSWARISAYLSLDCSGSTSNCGDYGYLCTQLNQPLIPGRYYYYEFYMQPDQYYHPNNYGCSFGIYFTHDKPEQNRSDRIKVTPQINTNQTNSNSYSNGWLKFSGYYYATIDYDWLTLGTFDQSAPGFNANYFVDDVKLIEIGTTCPPAWLIENTMYSNTQTELFEASNYITAGYNVGFFSEDGPVKVISGGADITYKAGQEITLKDGFSVERGGDFHAYIAPCGIDCPGESFSRDLSTGVPDDGGPITPGWTDDTWKYISDNTGNPPLSNNLFPVSTSIPNNAWAPSLTAANWINPSGNEFSQFGDGYYKFEAEFVLPPTSDIRNPQIIIHQAAVDNSAKVYLNNNPIKFLGFIDPPGFNQFIPFPWPGSGFCDNDNFNQIHNLGFVISDPSKFVYNGANKLTVEIYNHNPVNSCGSDNITNVSRMGLYMVASLNYWSCGLNQNANCRATSDDDFLFSNSPVYSEKNNILLIPNPAKDYFIVRSESNSTGRIEILNTLGDKVFSTDFFGEIFISELSSYRSGIYFVKIVTTEGHEYIEKLIIR